MLSSELAAAWPAALDARYVATRVIARGGFGLVVEARDRETGDRVAVKLMADASDATLTERFLHEARTIARLVHPHVVPLLAFGVDHEHPFMVLPFIEGASMRERLKAGPLPWRVVAAWTADLAKGLAAIHAAGIVHRDLKPDNVLLSGERAMITDFGISKSRSSGIRTATGVILGTPGYIAPEALIEEPVTGRSDLYALGVLAYEAIAGFRPLQRLDWTDPSSQRTRMEEMLAMREALPAGLSRVAPDCPRWLDALVMRLLDRDPAARPSGTELSHEIAPRLQPRSVEDTVRVAGAA